MYYKSSESKMQTLQNKKNPEVAHMNILALIGVKSKIKIKVQLMVLDLSIAAAKHYEEKKKQQQIIASIDLLNIIINMTQYMLSILNFWCATVLNGQVKSQKQTKEFVFIHFLVKYSK